MPSVAWRPTIFQINSSVAGDGRQFLDVASQVGSPVRFHQAYNFGWVAFSSVNANERLASPAATRISRPFLCREYYLIRKRTVGSNRLSGHEFDFMMTHANVHPLPVEEFQKYALDDLRHRRRSNSKSWLTTTICFISRLPGRGARI
jgi:hypothetical protein